MARTLHSQSTPPPDVLILGGGIIGLSCAHALATSGASVELWESRSALAQGSSHAGAGMLAPLAEVPDDGPFFEICRQARDMWRDLAPRLYDATGIDLDYDHSRDPSGKTSGTLVLDEGQLPALRRSATELGERHRVLEPAQARALIPDLAPSTTPALHLPDEHRIDNRAACAALAEHLRHLGVRWRLNHKALEVRARPNDVVVTSHQGDYSAGKVLVCAGAWSGTIAGLPPLPVFPVRGQMLRLDAVDWPFIGSLRGSQLYAVRRRGGGLLVGATVEPEADFEVAVTAQGIDHLRSFIDQHLPALRNAPISSTWAGLRPGTPDQRPLIGPIHNNLWLATGHYRNGILLAPWTAQFISRWLDSGRNPDPIAARLFAHDRHTVVTS